MPHRGADLERPGHLGVVADDAGLVLEVEHDRVDAPLVDEGEHAGPQHRVAPGRRGDVDAPHARVGDRDHDRRGRAVAGPVGGFERDGSRGRPVVAQGEAAVVADLDRLAVGGQLGALLDGPGDAGAVADVDGVDRRRRGEGRGGAVDGEAPGVHRVAEGGSGHRHLERVVALGQGGGRAPHHDRAEHGGLLDRLAVDGERRLGGLVVGGELEVDLEGGGVEGGDGRPVADPRGVDVDPGGPVHEHRHEGDRAQRDEGGEHGADLDVALLGPEHDRPLGPALVHGQRPRPEVEAPAGEGSGALAATPEAPAVVGLGTRFGVAQRGGRHRRNCPSATRAARGITRTRAGGTRGPPAACRWRTRPGGACIPGRPRCQPLRGRRAACGRAARR